MFVAVEGQLLERVDGDEHWADVGLNTAGQGESTPSMSHAQHMTHLVLFLKFIYLPTHTATKKFFANLVS